MREQPSRITQTLHPGYDAVPIIDAIPQISLFVKLKLTNCAPISGLPEIGSLCAQVG